MPCYRNENGDAWCTFEWDAFTVCRKLFLAFEASNCETETETEVNKGANMMCQNKKANTNAQVWKIKPLKVIHR